MSLAGVAIEYPDRRMRSSLPGVVVRESWRDDVSGVVASGWSRVMRRQLLKQTDPFAPRVEPKSGARTVVLDGFFQNREWWLPTWQVVARQINDRRPDGLDDLRRENRAAIKLRRSDYLGRGIVLTDDYYRTALRQLDLRDRDVLVICEDVDYLPHFAELLAEEGCTLRTPEPLTGNPNVDDFWHLAAAQTQVLANSSYCWWAAAVARVAMAETEAVYPMPWLPNAWNKGPMPDMGIPGWTAVTTEFA
jgi:hypothetical protein